MEPLSTSFLSDCRSDRRANPESSDGTPVIETTWHRVVAWEGEGIQNLQQLQKGSNVHVIGRIRSLRYIAADGTEKTVFEIIANKVEQC